MSTLSFPILERYSALTSDSTLVGASRSLLVAQAARVPAHADFAHVVCWSAWLVPAAQQLVRPLSCMAAGYFEVMFTQQVATYNQDLGVTNTAPMQMNWLLRSEAYAWYFLPPISSVLILWWYVACLSK